MFSNERINSVLFAVSFSLYRIASGDTIALNNGDQITGSVISMSGGRLVADTAYANGINIDWAHIRNLQTDSNVILLMRDESVYLGKVIGLSAGKIVLKTKMDRRLSVDLQSLDYINPPSYELNNLSHEGELNVGAFATKGNSQTDSLHIDGEWTFRKRSVRYILGGQYNLQKDQGTATANDARIDGEYHQFITDKWYALLNASASRDEFQDLNVRMTFGPGIGHEFWQSELRNLSLEGGLNYTYEDFETGLDDEYASLRWSLKFDYWIYKQDVQYFLKHTGLQSVEDVGGLVLNAQTGFKLPVTDRLKTKFEFEIDYNNKPAPGVKKTDLKYIVSGGYSW
jgi:putative salt-induced outer membrane protein YdiY